MTPQHQEALVRSAVYELLSAAFLYPQVGSKEHLEEGVGKLLGVVSSPKWTEVREVLEGLEDRLRSATDRRLVEEFVAVFGHTISTDCPPYEGEYGQAHVFQKAQTLADLASFYSAFGVVINPELKDRHDHLSVEMEFMHLLTFKEAHALRQGHGEERVDICRKAQSSFLAHHLANWIIPFSHRLTVKSAGWPVYSALSQLLKVHMEREFKGQGIDATKPREPIDESVAVDDQECYAAPREVGPL